MDFYISTGNRDGQWSNLPIFNNAGGSLTLGYSNPFYFDGFFIFSPNIYPNSFIISAYLSLVSNSNNSGAGSFEIYCVKQASPSIPASISDCENAPLTSSKVIWNIGATSVGSRYTSPNLSVILREVVIQSNYSRNDILIIQVRALAVTANKSFRTYEHISNSPPKLSLVSAYKGKIKISDLKSPVESLTIGDRPIRP